MFIYTCMSLCVSLHTLQCAVWMRACLCASAHEQGALALSCTSTPPPHPPPILNDTHHKHTQTHSLPASLIHQQTTPHFSGVLPPSSSSDPGNKPPLARARHGSSPLQRLTRLCVLLCWMPPFNLGDATCDRGGTG